MPIHIKTKGTGKPFLVRKTIKNDIIERVKSPTRDKTNQFIFTLA